MAMNQSANHFKELEEALQRLMRAEFKGAKEDDPLENIAGHFTDFLQGGQARDLAQLINRAVDAIEGDAAMPSGSSV